MNKTKTYAAMAILAGALCGPGQARSAPPCFAVPHREGVIRIDGDLADWNGTLVVNGLYDLNGLLYPRPCQWFLCWDEQNLYIASKSHLRPNERLIRDRRSPESAPDLVFDDSIEILLNPLGRDDRNSRYQFLANALGLVTGIRQQTVARQGVRDPDASWACQTLNRDWNPAVKPAFAISPDRRWLLSEMQIPVTNLGVRANQAGDIWGCVLSRNYKEPWQQTSVGGQGGWSLPANNARLTLVQRSAYCSLTKLAVSTNGSLRLAAVLHNPSDTDAECMIDVSLTQGKEPVASPHEGIRVAAGQSDTYRLTRVLSIPAKPDYALHIQASANGTPLMDYSVKLRPGHAAAVLNPFPPNAPYPVSIRPNPFRAEADIRADLIDLPEKASVTEVRWRVRNSENTVVARGSLSEIRYDIIEETIRFGPLPAGAYTVETTVMVGDRALQTDRQPFTRGTLDRLTCSTTLRDTERTVFLGDSITEADYYPMFLEFMLRSRYPGKTFWFMNLGIGGDTASLRMRGGWKGLLPDLRDFRPTLVIIMFGMNDRGSFGFDPRVLAGFMDAMTFNVETIRNEGARVLVMSSTPMNKFSDPDWDADEANDMLRRQNEALATYCGENGLPFLDLFSPMLDVCRNHAKLSEGDPVHPSPQGHLFMAALVAEKLGVNPVIAEATIDAGSGRVTTQRQCRVSELVVKDNGLTFTKQDDALPLPLPRNSRYAVEALPLVHARNRHTLTVRGLSAGTYRLRIDGDDVGAFTAEQLAAGIDQLPLKGPAATRADAIGDLIMRRNELMRYHWRKYLRGAEPKAPRATGWRDPGREELERQIRDLETELADSFTTRPHAWKFVRVKLP